MFGRKKKDEQSEAKQGGQTSPVEASSPSVISPPMQGPSRGPTVAQTQSRGQGPSPSSSPTFRQPISSQPSPPTRRVQDPFPPSYPSEETSLSRLLQSLLQDIPTPSNAGDDASGSHSIPPSTPEYVPLRQTPPSRAMTIGPGGKGSKDDEEWEEAEPKNKLPPTGIVRPPVPMPVETQPARTEIKGPTVPPKPLEPVDRAGKVEKPEKPEKPEKQAKETPSKKETRDTQGFNHIFQITQGNLETPGFVVLNGPVGSGRTTLCSGLADGYVKMGNPCLYVTFDQAPSSLRDQMKKVGTNAAQYESEFKLIIVDGYTAQSEGFSMEAYYVEQPFDLDNVQSTLMSNTQVFLGEKVRVLVDSLDSLTSKVPQKDFGKKFGDLVAKMKGAGATLIVSVDMSKLSKDLAGSLEDMADCIIDLSSDEKDANGRVLKVRRLNRSAAKLEPETIEIDSSKGLVFV